MLKLTVLAYLQLLLLALNSRLVNREQYGGIAMVAATIALLYCFLFRTMLQEIETWQGILGYVLGATLGNLSGAWLHSRFYRRGGPHEGEGVRPALPLRKGGVPDDGAP